MMKINRRFVEEQIRESTKYNSLINCSHSAFCVVSKKVNIIEYKNFDNVEIINIIAKCIEFEQNGTRRNGEYEIKLMRGVGNSKVRVVEFKNVNNRELRTFRIHLDICLKQGCETSTTISRIIFYSKKDQEKVKRSFYG